MKPNVQKCFDNYKDFQRMFTNFDNFKKAIQCIFRVLNKEFAVE